MIYLESEEKPPLWGPSCCRPQIAAVPLRSLTLASGIWWSQANLVGAFFFGCFMLLNAQQTPRHIDRAPERRRTAQNRIGGSSAAHATHLPAAEPHARGRGRGVGLGVGLLTYRAREPFRSWRCPPSRVTPTTHRCRRARCRRRCQEHRWSLEHDSMLSRAWYHHDIMLSRA